MIHLFSLPLDAIPPCTTLPQRRARYASVHQLPSGLRERLRDLCVALGLKLAFRRTAIRLPLLDSLCNTQDVTWGTREGGVQNQLTAQHARQAASAASRAARARMRLGELELEEAVEVRSGESREHKGGIAALSRPVNLSASQERAKRGDGNRSERHWVDSFGDCGPPNAAAASAANARANARRRADSADTVPNTQCRQLRGDIDGGFRVEAAAAVC